MENDAKSDHPNVKQLSEWYDVMDKTLSAVFLDLKESKWFVA
jgi:hypothetical protein